MCEIMEPAWPWYCCNRQGSWPRSAPTGAHDAGSPRRSVIARMAGRRGPRTASIQPPFAAWLSPRRSRFYRLHPHHGRDVASDVHTATVHQQHTAAVGPTLHDHGSVPEVRPLPWSNVISACSSSTTSELVTTTTGTPGC